MQTDGGPSPPCHCPILFSLALLGAREELLRWLASSSSASAKDHSGGAGGVGLVAMSLLPDLVEDCNHCLDLHHFFRAAWATKMDPPCLSCFQEAVAAEGGEKDCSRCCLPLSSTNTASYKYLRQEEAGSSLVLPAQSVLNVGRGGRGGRCEGGDGGRICVTMPKHTPTKKRGSSVVTTLGTTSGTTSAGPVFICIIYAAIGSVTIFFNFPPQSTFLSVLLLMAL